MFEHGPRHRNKGKVLKTFIQLDGALVVCKMITALSRHRRGGTVGLGGSEDPVFILVSARLSMSAVAYCVN